MESLLAHCAAAFSGHPGIFAAFFLGGLTGSLTHCFAMCGPLVAAQTACGSCSSSPSALSLGYHLGRLTSYGGLGFAAAFLGKQIAALPHWHIVAAAMLVLAGGMFLLSSLPRQKRSICRVTAKTNYVRGVLMGFMPCGLIYAALMMAATLANPFKGMLAMWLFVLGTVPVLMLAHQGAAFLSRKWQPAVHRVGRAAMAMNGILLLATAINTIG